MDNPNFAAPQTPQQAPEIPAPAPPPAEPAPLSAGKGRPVFRGALFGILAIIVLVTAYGAYAYLQGAWPFERQEVPEAVDMSDWKTYRNTVFGYEFNYPADLQIVSDTHGPYPGDEFQFAGGLNISGLGFDGFIRCNNPGSGAIRIYRPQPFSASTADGRNIQGQFGLILPMGEQQPSEEWHWQGHFGASPRGDLCDFGFSSPGDPDTVGELVKQILSTFRFTEVPTSTGRLLFSDASFGFTFEYPADWYKSQDDAFGSIGIRNTLKPVWTGLDVPTYPDDWAFGTLVSIRQIPSPSLESFIRSQTLSDEIYVQSEFPGLLRAEGPLPVIRELYLGWSNGTGVTITLRNSAPLDRSALEMILSTFRFTR